MMTAKEEDNQRHNCNEGKQHVVAAKQAPGRPGIAPINQFKKTIYNGLLSSVPDEAEYQLLGQLIQRYHQESNAGNATIRRSQNAL